MTDIVELLRTANPVQEPTAFAPDVRARIVGRIVARDRRRRPLARLLMALTRSRVLALAAGALLLAGGTAAAVVALTDQPSAPPSGRLHPGPGVPQSLHYHVAAVPDLNGGAAGWCLFDTEQLPIGHQGGGSCGDVQLAGHPIVALDAGSGASLVNRPHGRLRAGTSLTYLSYEYVAYVTTAVVAAVRVTPSLTIRTRPDHQLPNGYRIAVWIRAHLVHRKISRHPRDRPPASSRVVTNTLPNASVTAAVALDPHGHAIGLPGQPFARLHDAARFWQAQHASNAQPSLHSPPVGACEIDTNALPHAHLFFGSVVQHIRGFPELAGRTFLSCAETQFGSSGLGVDAAILLDAQHPGALPEPIAGATTVRPGIVNVTSSALGQRNSLTARRVGNAWLAIEAAGTLEQRINILSRLRACVHLGPSPCPSP